MPNKEQSALLVHRENYVVPKGQEQVVHIKIAKVTRDGGFIEPPRIIREEPKFFESVAKRNLETLGYTVEILYHPQEKYSSVRIEDKDAQLRAVKSEVDTLKAEATKTNAVINEKDEEIARLKAELAKAKEQKPTNEGEEKPETKEEKPKESKKKEKKPTNEGEEKPETKEEKPKESKKKEK